MSRNFLKSIPNSGKCDLETVSTAYRPSNKIVFLSRLEVTTNRWNYAKVVPIFCISDILGSVLEGLCGCKLIILISQGKNKNYQMEDFTCRNLILQLIGWIFSDGKDILVIFV